MNHFAGRILLLADRANIFRDMGSGFREKRESFNPSDLLWWLFVAAAVIAVFGVVASILAKQDKHRLYNSPRALFNALCKAHDLDRGSRMLIKQLAQSQQLAIPARMFLEPDRFDPALLGPDLRAYRDTVIQLRNKLFAVEVPPAAADAALV